MSISSATSGTRRHAVFYAGYAAVASALVASLLRNRARATRGEGRRRQGTGCRFSAYSFSRSIDGDWRQGSRLHRTRGPHTRLLTPPLSRE
jgi:hypothetical protein